MFGVKYVKRSQNKVNSSQQKKTLKPKDGRMDKISKPNRKKLLQIETQLDTKRAKQNQNQVK